MEKGEIIQLTKEERDEGYRIGRERYERNRENAIHPNFSKGTDLIRIDQEGVCGEIALAKGLGVLESHWEKFRNTEIRNFREDEGDVFFNGFKIDVKTTKYKNGHLLIKKHKKDAQIDVYALITGWYGRYSFAGFCKREDIERFAELKEGIFWIPQFKLSNSSFQ